MQFEYASALREIDSKGGSIMIYTDVGFSSQPTVKQKTTQNAILRKEGKYISENSFIKCAHEFWEALLHQVL